MSVRLHRGGREVRWRDADGRQRGRRFATEEAARAAEEALAEVSPPPAARTRSPRSRRRVLLQDCGEGVCTTLAITSPGRRRKPRVRHRQIALLLAPEILTRTE